MKLVMTKVIFIDGCIYFLVSMCTDFTIIICFYNFYNKTVAQKGKPYSKGLTTVKHKQRKKEQKKGSEAMTSCSTGVHSTAVLQQLPSEMDDVSEWPWEWIQNLTSQMIHQQVSI